MHKINKSLLVGVLSAAPLFAHSAENVELPSTLAMTAYGTGSAGYTQMVSIGNLLQNEYGTSVRILPGENDVSRMTPLRMGRCHSAPAVSPATTARKVCCFSQTLIGARSQFV